MNDLTTTQAIDAALSSRRSVRAFLPTPVAPQLVQEILQLAARAPSGTNTQPWQVTVLTGESKNTLSAAIVSAAREPDARTRYTEEYGYYPSEWREPYLSRRRKIGWDLYRLLGIEKGDTEKMRLQEERNYHFFGAPVGMIFTLDKVMGRGSLIDYGMFLENITIAARARGLDTCAQAAFCPFHSVIRQQLALADDCYVVCGMSLGYADNTQAESQLQTERAPLNEWVRFLD